MTDFQRIPVVDLEPWWGQDPGRRASVADEVDRVFREVGFMYVAGHGVPDTLRESTFQAARSFFSLPDSEKAVIDAAAAGSYWGYLSDRSETSDPAASADRKEGFDLHRVIPDGRLTTAPAQVRERLAAPNLWPGLDGFRETVEAYLAAVTDLARTVFEIVAVANGLPRSWFARLLDDPIVSMRLLHYPPQPPQADEFGIGAHHDYEALTILAQDEVGGLEVRSPTGQWVAAPPIAGTFVVNIGEMLARWSGGRYVATEHRVVNRSGRERYSVPVFFATNPAAALRSWHGKDVEPVVTAGEYLVERIGSIYGTPGRG